MSVNGLSRFCAFVLVSIAGQRVLGEGERSGVQWSPPGIASVFRSVASRREFGSMHWAVSCWEQRALCPPAELIPTRARLLECDLTDRGEETPAFGMMVQGVHNRGKYAPSPICSQQYGFPRPVPKPPYGLDRGLTCRWRQSNWPWRLYRSDCTHPAGAAAHKDDCVQ